MADDGAGIRGKVVAITGASSGIGEVTAILLAERGAKLVLGARRLDRLDALAVRITAAGGVACVARTNVTRRSDLVDVVGLARERHGRLDVLVNNAGIARISRFNELRVEDWDELIDVNVKGVLYGIAAALPVFRAQGSGHVVNVISTSGLRIVPLHGVYAATENAVRTVSEALRQEAGATLRVTGVPPGLRQDGAARLDARSGAQGRGARAHGGDRHRPGRDRPRGGLRDRAADRRGRGRHRGAADPGQRVQVNVVLR